MYLDNNNGIKPSQKTFKAMSLALEMGWADISAFHELGLESRRFWVEAHEALYDLLGADDLDNVIITSSGAEAASQAIMSAYYNVSSDSNRKEFLVINNSEASSLNAIKRLQGLGCSVNILECGKDGRVDFKQLEEMLTSKVMMLSLSWADGLTGVIQDLEELADLCYERGVLLHADATHILGKVDLELSEIKADYLSFNMSQVGAPQGTGALYVRRGVPFGALISGGAEQSGMRGGNISAIQLAGLTQASKEAKEGLAKNSMKMVDIRDYFEEKLKLKIEGVMVLFKGEERLPNTSCVVFKDVYNESLLYYLNRSGVYASCGGGNFQQLSHLLMNYGCDKISSRGSVSFSLNYQISKADVDAVVDLIGLEVERVRKFNSITIENRGVIVDEG